MASIVQRLTDRSISGRHINIDIHKYNGNTILLYWKNNSHKRCYTHILERKFLETSEFTLLLDHLYDSGLPGALQCLNLYKICKWNIPSCPFITSWHSISPRYRLFSLDIPDNQLCTCPTVPNFYDKTPMSIFCINKHRKYTSKIPHSSGQWHWSQYELELKSPLTAL